MKVVQCLIKPITNLNRKQNALISHLDCIEDKIPSKSDAVTKVQFSRFVTPRPVNVVIMVSSCSSSIEGSVILIFTLMGSMVDYVSGQLAVCYLCGSV